MNTRLRSGFLFGLILVMSFAVVSCLRDQTVSGAKPVGNVDRKLSKFAFIEDGRLAAFIISTQATIFREDEDYMPLEIAIANRDLKELSIRRESFVLVDEEGNRYPVAEPRELIDGYPLLDQDRQRFSELFGLISTRFSAYESYSSKLSPTRSGRPVQDVTNLPKFGVMIDFLYFPMPSTGLKGHRFELFLDTPQLEDPLFVRFVVP